MLQGAADSNDPHQRLARFGVFGGTSRKRCKEIVTRSPRRRSKTISTVQGTQDAKLAVGVRRRTALKTMLADTNRYEFIFDSSVSSTVIDTLSLAVEKEPCERTSSGHFDGPDGRS